MFDANGHGECEWKFSWTADSSRHNRTDSVDCKGKITNTKKKKKEWEREKEFGREEKRKEEETKQKEC